MRREPRPARVLFLHSSNEMFGADRVLLQVVESLLREPFFSPEVWLPDDVAEADHSVEKRLRELGVVTRTLNLPILRRKYLTPSKLPVLLFRFVSLWLRLVTRRPAVVYCATSAVLLAAPAARLAGCRSVVLHTQEIWAGREAKVLGVLAACCTSAVAISEASRRSLSGPVLRRARTISNAVPDSAGAAPIESGPRPLEFLMASRWNSWKGHETLLGAWDMSAAAPGHLTIVGSPPEAGESADVAGMVSRLRHPDSVSIVGQVADITPFLDGADFMLVPSDDPEPFGLVAIEAFARYRPVIGTAGGGLLEIVTPGKNGLLFDRRDVRSLAAILSTVDREGAERMGRAARCTFVERFSLDSFLEAFGAFWSDIEQGLRGIPGPDTGSGRR